MLKKDFKSFGEILEGEAINMHAVIMTSVPPIFYWTPKTLEIVLAVGEWREEGLPVYFTIDAGPNVHLICEEKDKGEVIDRLKTISKIKEIIINKPAQGTYLVNKHLF